jgi:hypothetical protein
MTGGGAQGTGESREVTDRHGPRPAAAPCAQAASRCAQATPREDPVHGPPEVGPTVRASLRFSSKNDLMVPMSSQ